jgi:hypothetical protein
MGAGLTRSLGRGDSMRPGSISPPCFGHSRRT